MDEYTDEKIAELSNIGDLSSVDKLLESAASSINRADYESAIADFEKVIEITHNIFGDSEELMEVKRKINEIQDLLSSM